MSKFNNSVDDSFDDILAKIEEPTNVASVKSKIPTEAKKPRFSVDNDDEISDSLLANFPMPDEASASSSSQQQIEKSVNIPASKTNCVLVNPKQRGMHCDRELLFNLIRINLKINIDFV